MRSFDIHKLHMFCIIMFILFNRGRKEDSEAENDTFRVLGVKAFRVFGKSYATRTLGEEIMWQDPMSLGGRGAFFLTIPHVDFSLWMVNMKSLNREPCVQEIRTTPRIPFQQSSSNLICHPDFHGVKSNSMVVLNGSTHPRSPFFNPLRKVVMWKLEDRIQAPFWAKRSPY